MTESSLSQATARRYVFVYGTLRRGSVRDINRLRPTPSFMGVGRVAGTLYHLGQYPGVTLGGSAHVWGEVYEISAELEQLLDEIEEVLPQATGEYVKREQVVELATPAAGGKAGQALLCVIYEISPDRLAGKPVIEQGDWVIHCGTTKAL